MTDDGQPRAADRVDTVRACPHRSQRLTLAWILPSENSFSGFRNGRSIASIAESGHHRDTSADSQLEYPILLLRIPQKYIPSWESTCRHQAL
jgi:hypothetical protein